MSGWRLLPLESMRAVGRVGRSGLVRRSVLVVADVRRVAKSEVLERSGVGPDVVTRYKDHLGSLPMASPKLRTIRVGPVVYLWHTHHRHNQAPSTGKSGCAEVFTAFREELPTRPVRILFPETNKHGRGFPGQKGVVVHYRDPTWHINLNRPRIARLLIELAVASGWDPGRSRREFVIENGYLLLRENGDRVVAALNEDAAKKRR